VTTTVRIVSDWTVGYCADVTVVNSSAAPVVWKVQLQVPGRVNNLWNGDFTQAGAALTVWGKDYNKTVQPKGTQAFGYCANR
jgi:endoglucanase